ncbi:MAG: hypothetical protein JSW11_04875, partial [Candidatus Heimdallarchaeota archaeon]
MEWKRIFSIIMIICFLFGLNNGDMILKHQQTPDIQIDNQTFSSIVSSIAQSNLPSNLVVAYDNSHTPAIGLYMTNLEGNLTTAGSTFHMIEGGFSIPTDTNVLLIPYSTISYSASELNIINNWFTGDGARLLWVAGDSDYGGYFNNT